MSGHGDFLLIAWVVTSPFAIAACVGSVAVARRAIARAHPLTLVAGWIGVVLLVGGALVAHSGIAVMLGAPLAGLAVWSRGQSGGEDHGDDDDDGGGPPPDDGPGPDWDAFERAFRAYASRPPARR